jgi:hypothetical protein
MVATAHDEGQLVGNRVIVVGDVIACRIWRATGHEHAQGHLPCTDVGFLHWLRQPSSAFNRRGFGLSQYARLLVATISSPRRMSPRSKASAMT